jgi:hypothetical protein
MMSYMINVMPYTDNLLNGIEIFNELSLLVTSYFLLSFTDWVGEPEFRYTIGWTFTGFLGFNIFVNWCVLFYRLLQPLFQKIGLRI